MQTRYWIGVVSKNHVERGTREGIAQVCRGKAAPLKRMKQGDWLIYYSPKLTFEGKDPLKCFTAIGQLTDDEVYSFEMAPGFKPFRRKVAYKPCREVSILDLIEKLSFIKNKKSWGAVFRFGLVEIPKDDFDLISKRMLKS